MSLSEGNTMLLVEDDSIIREVLGAKLVEAGFRVVHAESVHEARCKLYQQKFCSVVLDLHLAQCSGEEVIEYIRTSSGMNWCTPIVVISGYLETDLLKRIGLQIQDALVKPFKPQELVERVLATLDRFPDLGDLTGLHEGR